ncbi:MAG TPA: CHASE4 domain-containing protein [Candidatus Omnitrophota bacterium]|nr:CHASE4 domain-containing protein [Candidatus Omnitrophota bacterium]
MLFGKLQYGIGIRRRVIFIFLFFGLIVVLTSFLFTRFWISSFDQVSKIRLLRQGYASTVSIFDSRKKNLDFVVSYSAKNPELIDIISGAGTQKASDYFKAIEEQFSIDGVVVLSPEANVFYQDSDLGMDKSGTGIDLFKYFSRSEKVSGYWLAQNNMLWLFSSQPVYKPDSRDKRIGTLIFGIMMDYKLLDELYKRLELKVEFFHNKDFFFGKGDYFGPRSIGDSLKRSLRILLYTQAPYHVFKMTDNNQGAYGLDTLLRDFRGDPVAILRFKDDLRFQFFPQRDIFYLLWLAFLLMSAAFFLMLKFLTRDITSPLIRLKKAIQEIAFL